MQPCVLKGFCTTKHCTISGQPFQHWFRGLKGAVASKNPKREILLFKGLTVLNVSCCFSSNPNMHSADSHFSAILHFPC